jgi:AcrR family transcriptional regulator
VRHSGPLVDAAVALWRANGYANTTVAGICRAADISKSLFFFYFPRKEDLLSEMAVLSTQAAHRVAHELSNRQPSYEISEFLEAVLTSLKRHMRRNPPDAPYMFTELFQKAREDGKLSLVTEGARHWAADAYGDRQ